jgi:hypothetical protein
MFQSTSGKTGQQRRKKFFLKERFPTEIGFRAKKLQVGRQGIRRILPGKFHGSQEETSKRLIFSLPCDFMRLPCPDFLTEVWSREIISKSLSDLTKSAAKSGKTAYFSPDFDANRTAIRLKSVKIHWVSHFFRLDLSSPTGSWDFRKCTETPGRPAFRRRVKPILD